MMKPHQILLLFISVLLLSWGNSYVISHQPNPLLVNEQVARLQKQNQNELAPLLIGLPASKNGSDALFSLLIEKEEKNKKKNKKNLLVKKTLGNIQFSDAISFNYKNSFHYYNRNHSFFRDHSNYFLPCKKYILFQVFRV